MYKFLLSRICLIIYILFVPFFAQAEKIGKISDIRGIKEYQLIGYGLVIGLNGTGDQMPSKSSFSTSSLQSLLNNLNIDIPEIQNTRINNIASVIVIGKMNALSQLGETIDITVSSIGNAKNLNGGVLLMTPLKGVNNETYATAQGILVPHNQHNIEDNYYLHNNINQDKKSLAFNTGFIPDGAVIQKEINNNQNAPLENIRLNLKKNDFSLNQKIANIINNNFPNIANPINSRVIQITTTSKNIADQIKLIANIQNLDVPLFQKDNKILSANTNLKNNTPINLNKDSIIHPCFIKYKNILIIFNNHNYYQNNINKKMFLLKNKIKNHRYDNNSKSNELLYILNKIGMTDIDISSIIDSMSHVKCTLLPIGNIK
ncbi:Flagellar P-ring protein [Buchnera aphidicola (Thelaxes suberi)]|uniref:flagellar basal body P-ring protein FlgI n=1 Tax=Buchnera aphidicola TaxID=9 RepID=UPI00346419D1